MRSRLGTWTSTATSAGRRLPKRCRETHHARSSAGIGGSTTADISKGSRTCSEPGHFDACPLPRHPLRNGHLNQMAYSLFLFMRDVADDDFVGWIDRQLGAVDPQSPDRLPALREAIIGPLRNVYGVADKVLAMALSSLLLGAGKRRPLWVEVGATFVAVDTLVHNFLHRTGILRRLCADHPYGDRCYRPGGCAGILGLLAAQH